MHNPNLPPEVRLVAASLTYEQPADEMQDDGMPTQRITLSIEDIGHNEQRAWLVVKTERWCVDDARQIQQLAQDFAARLPEMQQAILGKTDPASAS